MRLLFFAVALACSVQYPSQAATDKLDHPKYAAFVRRVDTIARNAVLPEFQKHPEHLKGGSLYMRFLLDRQGHITRLDVLSTKNSPVAEQIARARLLATKFPAIPSEVIAERGQALIGIQARCMISL